jgi:hypothetical protein
MAPISLLVVQKMAALLKNGAALQQQLGAMAQSSGMNIPAITPSQVVLTAAGPDLSDKNVQLIYPRVCLYSSGVRNTQNEKFRSFSGAVFVTAEVWASGNLIDEAESRLHYYAEAVAQLLQKNKGDWGDGVFFGGAYDIQIQSPKIGGVGFVQSAKITCSVGVSQA